MSDHPEDKNERREFLKTAGGVAVGAAVGGVALSQAGRAKTKTESVAEGSGSPGVQYAMLIDLRRCIGCHSCSVACKADFDVPMGAARSWVEYTEKGQYPNVSRTFLPRLCNQCSQPDCVRVCPTGATYKRPQDGIVVIDQGICIGCLYCAQACPLSLIHI